MIDIFKTLRLLGQQYKSAVCLTKYFKNGLLPSKKVGFICLNQSPVKTMNNVFYSILKALLLRILTGKKHPKIKLQRVRKIWTFGSLVHQINSF